MILIPDAQRIVLEHTPVLGHETVPLAGGQHQRAIVHNGLWSCAAPA